MGEQLSVPEGAQDDECLHCTYADALNAINLAWTAKGRRPDAGSVVRALLSLAGDLISEAPDQCRGGVLLDSMSYLAERSGGKLTLTDDAVKMDAAAPAKLH